MILLISALDTQNNDASIAVVTDDKTDKLFDHLSFLSVSIGAPCLATHMYLTGGYRKEIAYAHIGVALLPCLSRYMDRRDEGLEKAVIGLNLLSLAYVTYVKEDFHMLGAAVLYALNYFVLTPNGDSILGVPGMDVFTYGLAAFNCLVLKGFNVLNF